MPIRVLVVDDSSFFRRRVSEIIEQDPELIVIDTATNGEDAVEKVVRLKPDVVTMDIEMPVMDGISAVKNIMQQYPVPILMFSSLTHDGAKATLDALDAGALDFLPKKFEDIARNREEASQQLLARIKHIAKRRLFRRNYASQVSVQSEITRNNQTVSAAPSLHSSQLKQNDALSVGTFTSALDKKLTARPSGRKGRFKLLAIGTSTGGPVALQTILTKLPANFPTPIILIQHMPAAFTAAFAARLNSMCQINVKEAEQGDVLKAGHAYLAPGGKQMMLDGTMSSCKILIKNDASERLTYKPSVDLTFASAAKVYRDSVLAVVLTGMGADGREGARMLKNAGALIWAQDEASCVVYGMPQAVTVAGIASENIPINQMSQKIQSEIYV